MRERETDEPAEEALVNDDPWARAGFSDAATSLRIVELAMEAKAHAAVVAGRVRFETRNYRRFVGLTGRVEVRRIFPRNRVYTGSSRATLVDSSASSPLRTALNSVDTTQTHGRTDLW